LRECRALSEATVPHITRSLTLRDYLANGSVALSVVAGCAGVSRSVVIDAMELAGAVFSGLSALVIEDVEDAGEVICVRARTRDEAVACPACGTETGRVHEYQERAVRTCRPMAAGSWSRCGSAGCAARSRAARGRRSGSRSRASWIVTSGAPRG
jgi:hypothetical protein